MEWIERRAGLIGVGAIVVAAVALGVALADRGGHERRMLRVGHGFFAPYGAPGMGDGPMLQGDGGGPGFMAPGGGPMMRRFGTGPGRPPGAGGFLVGGALHGELTLPAPNGKYQTIDLQRGTVTSATASSITVRSPDGFTRSYALPKAMAGQVTKGDTVELRASVANGKATVTSLNSTRIRG